MNRPESKDLESQQKQEEAVKLRRKAAEEDEFLNFGIKTIGNAIGITVALSKPGSQWSAAKPIWDEMGEVFKLFHTNDYAAKASALEEEARKILLDTAFKRYQQAGVNLQNAKKHIEEAEPLAKKVEETSDQFSGEAETNFDETTEGDFRFANLKKAIGWAETTYDIAKVTYAAAYAAEQAAKQLGRFEGWDPPDRGEVNALIAALVTDARNWLDIGVKRRDEADGVRKKMNEIYEAATKAQLKSKGKGAARAKK